MNKTILILGANSDVAKECIQLYTSEGNYVIAASRSTDALHEFVAQRNIDSNKIAILYFDAVDFDSHQPFYDALPTKPHIVLYAAGYLKNNEEALRNWQGSFQMMKVHYCGAVSILNIIAMDVSNDKLERIIGLSSLSGVRGRKSNFVYGSTKSAFTQYLAGLRQYLFPRKIKVNVVVAGYIRSKMTAGLDLPESLMLEPSFIARAVVNAGNQFTIVPGFKWKMIYHILRLMPEKLVAKLP
ncbi:SDR family NAD(P)-dependent oxidoreductase [Danxiaibacter flavus]|uniref:SDR family NAD(P)-dependent oxidoreductase n=1 Tax=Danxiaibacter flavus TaxID=3049108 RepID=A0ABV3ZNN9_9BACT|nr:SDR family NAD(P)-dependent oxidoreductase [Chitinophagaceae bacterium DXS]